MSSASKWTWRLWYVSDGADATKETTNALVETERVTSSDLLASTTSVTAIGGFPLYLYTAHVASMPTDGNGRYFPQSV